MASPHVSIFEPLILPAADSEEWGPHQIGGSTSVSGIPGDLISLVDGYRNVRVCDFSQQGKRIRDMQAAQGHNRGRVSATPSEDEKDKGFQLVDTSSAPRKHHVNKYSQPRWQDHRNNRYQQQHQRDGRYQKGGGGKSWGPAAGGRRHQQQSAYQQGWGRGQGVARGIKEWSVAPNPDWQLVRELPFTLLAKAHVDPKKVAYEDLVWCGTGLKAYEKTYDRVSPKLTKSLKQYPDIAFYNVSTGQDPVIEQLLTNQPVAKGQDVTVACTDNVLSVMMAANRSVYSWDLVITRLDNTILIDTREGSNLDMLTVNETSSEPPATHPDESAEGTKTEAFNTVYKVGEEATCINQNLTVQLLSSSLPEKSNEYPNPFDQREDDEDEEEEEEEKEELLPPSNVAYRYRKVDLPRVPEESKSCNISMIVRTEVDAYVPQGEGQQQEQQPVYAKIRALNEIPSTQQQKQPWRSSLESQKGAVLATEVHNNAFKLGRWVASALLAGTNVFKLGYVTRARMNDPFHHSLLSVQTYKTEEFAKQIGMNTSNAFGIVQAIVDLVMQYKAPGAEEEEEDEDGASSFAGKFLLLKEPSKSMIRLYAVPWEEFEESDEEEEEELSDEEDEEEEL
ncbi:eukaryotic translation initiation factor 3 subunit, putative [Perkinsus marinus ATCC 50983]|uniref:Eukaryotic translation initiation factor 3 subunit, putative n=1 Tax=Perkinsus marinus (strain ATCC 50983 / TXsc) TaxID=423536 RepID=C5KY40_PERM5|nr:eukaryotic translation initiation factor 3 subunit, putative [Perkinsus marinus ATCC 50983]EER10647.1 eukaryotic translation initiation factor 3 subunit, putative [Perkinsus marinus ATCC 50983]|eukprot:XP_002778852.1 eukaryotic translation initiation factor 3 subunit, putative [Perkinsus marinus ATCC 50983]